MLIKTLKDLKTLLIAQNMNPKEQQEDIKYY